MHRHPELAFEETRTAGIVAHELQALGLEVQAGVGKTGVVGLLEGDHDGPTLLVRADMDALPIHETNQADYISTVDGKMHACGHDGHTSIGLAVAKVLSHRRSEIHGRVKFVFQPAEEIGKGAQAMIDDGVLSNPRPAASIGLHVWNDLPLGKVAVTPGPAMSAADNWKCIVTGYGGHGASPQQAQDPIVAAAQIVSAIQTIASRNADPLDSTVVTVGTIYGGDAFNIIPASVEMNGTMRTYKDSTKQMVHRRLHEICEGIARSMGCTAELTIDQMTLAVDNDVAISDRIAALAAEVVGADNVRRDVRTMGSEDMSYLMDDCYFSSARPMPSAIWPIRTTTLASTSTRRRCSSAELLAKAAASFVISGN